VRAGRSFKRAQVPSIPTQTDGIYDAQYQGLPSALYDCLACGDRHQVGYCPLKQAGVEHCGLCGLAHFGHQRTCPHLHSEVQVAIMLGTLKQSTESPVLVEEATKYLRGIRGDLVRRKKQKAEREERERMRRSLPGQQVNGVGGSHNIPSIPIPDFRAATPSEQPRAGVRARSH
jgi:chromodomain-helicase-DNA-binding protein 4